MEKSISWINDFVTELCLKATGIIYKNVFMYVHDIDTGAMQFFPLEPFIASSYI